ncbi:DUF1127 domain-containing protein [Paracoccus laeviglucosivorans]|uniref:YjiS-like domain-containing protein n=1 Tax=Paracoccus laeviglucosivorans TaxID=1197861 RepID=A0A521AH75_9RHOB|nr:DUF1127 domain-containing protein [Paracoccus laeviglucosivorans]SMO34156.1 protein of unknown function [Paracoccus laeviglucosivorans]
MTLTATNIERRNDNGLVAKLIGSINAYILGRRVAKRTTEELNALRDRDLADLGISRLDIARLAAEARKAAVAKHLAA